MKPKLVVRPSGYATAVIRDGTVFVSFGKPKV